MSPVTARRARGFTLVELMVALTVSILSIAAASSLLIQQQRSYSFTSRERAEQEAGRQALREIVGRLRSAGYGVDPNLAFDFGVMATVPRPNLPNNLVSIYASSYACTSPVRCRDQKGGSATGSDEIVFISRDPSFLRTATAVSSSSITFTGDVKQPLYAGQILQVSCMVEPQQRAYVTVAQTVNPPTTPSAANPVTVTLLGGLTDTSRPVFPRENMLLSDTCFNPAGFGDSKPVVTLVNRYRFFVEWYAANGGIVAAQTEGARPYLMLDRGLGGTTPLDPVVVASDVEDLQFAYLFRPTGAGLANQVVGATPSTNIADETFPMSLATAPPAYDDAPDAASRTTGHPANLLAVRVSVVVRSSEYDAGLSQSQDRLLPAAGNRAAFTGVAGYARTLFETTVPIRNLASSTYIYPTTNTAGGTGVNVGGG